MNTLTRAFGKMIGKFNKLTPGDKRYFLYCLKEWEKLQAKLDQEKKEEVLS